MSNEILKVKQQGNKGFQLDILDEKDYVLGSARSLGVREELAPDGQWDKWKPVFELQRNQNYDSFSCVSYAQTNCLEFIHNRKYGNENNRSERFTSVMSGTVPRQGNSLKNVAESTRKNGTVAQQDCPFPPTEAEFFAPISQELKNKGQEWLKEYDFGYEFTKNILFGYKIDIERAMEALKYSPLQTAIDASTKRTDDFKGWDDSVVIYGYEFGNYWKIFGSYPETTGNFDWDYPFYCPFRFSLTKKSNDILPMNLYKASNSPKVFLVSPNNKKHWIKTAKVYDTYFVDWSLIQVVEPPRLDPLEEGEPITLPVDSLSQAIKDLLAKFGSLVKGK